MALIIGTKTRRNASAWRVPNSPELGLVLISQIIGTNAKFTLAAEPIAPDLDSSGTTLISLSAEGKVLVYEGLPKATLKATLSGTAPFESAVISGDTILAASSAANEGKGQVSVYRKQGDQWSETKKIVSSVAADTSFGEALAIQGDTQVISASSGVQVEFKSTSTSSELLSARLPFPEDAGITALAVDGDYILVGQSGIGVQVFIRNADTWDKQVLLIPEDGKVPKSFGSVLDFSERTALIGAPETNSFYVFTRGDTAWAQRHVFTDDKNPKFGQAVAIYDTDILATGSQGASLYIRENSPQWKLGISFKAQGERFGSAATITKGIAVIYSGDGLLLYEGKSAQWKQTSALK